MNTRLQVEHPVTELVTGRDLVHAQIRIAAGEPLWFTQDDVSLRGHAIEVRIYAEDPESGFIPSSGRITRLREPAGPGIRVDSGVYEGWEVAIHYDPLLAKLAVWAETRTKAIARLRRALTEYDVGGIKSTLPYFRALCADENYLAGDIDTQYLDRWIAERTTTGFGKEPVEELVLDLALVAAAMDSRDNAPKAAASTHDAQSNWKRAGRARSMRG